MPAKDKYHDQIISALQRDGWTIEAEHYHISIGTMGIFPDILASRGEQQKILVEIKGFYDRYSFTAQFAEAVGKYLLYRDAIDLVGLQMPVYIAVPQSAWETLLQRQIAQRMILQYQIRLMIVNIDKEEITQWID
jgi:hypothetical protein